MKIFSKYYFPDICISFTVIIICSSIWNIVMNNDSGLNIWFVLELAGIIALNSIIAYFLSKVEFKKWIYYWLIQGLIDYAVAFAAGYFLNWFGFRIESIVLFTIIFLIAFLSIILYTYQMQKQEEERINRLIEQRNVKNL